MCGKAPLVSFSVEQGPPPCHCQTGEKKEERKRSHHATSSLPRVASSLAREGGGLEGTCGRGAYLRVGSAGDPHFAQADLTYTDNTKDEFFISVGLNTVR